MTGAFRYRKPASPADARRANPPPRARTRSQGLRRADLFASRRERFRAASIWSPVRTVGGKGVVAPPIPDAARVLSPVGGGLAGAKPGGT